MEAKEMLASNSGVIEAHDPAPFTIRFVGWGSIGAAVAIASFATWTFWVASIAGAAWGLPFTTFLGTVSLYAATIGIAIVLAYGGRGVMRKEKTARWMLAWAFALLVAMGLLAWFLLPPMIAGAAAAIGLSALLTTPSRRWFAS